MSTSEQSIRTLLRAANVFTWSCPASGHFVEPQPEWMAFTGQTAEEMLGAGWLDAVHPDDRDVVACRWADAVARGVPAVSEHRVRRHDGVWRWVSIQAAPFRDERSTSTEWVGMSTDVTERRLADEQLRRSQETLRIAKAAAQLGLFDLDFATDHIVCDERLRDLWGFAPDDNLTQDSFYARIHPDDVAAVREAVAKALDPSSSGLYRATYRVLPGGDSPLRWLEATAQFFFDNGRPVRAVGSMFDVTERKQAEDRMSIMAQQRQFALSAAKLGWWQYDATSRVATWDDGFSAIFGLSGDRSPIEEIFRRSIHPDDLPSLQAQEAAALSENAAGEFDLEYRVIWPDGQIRWINAHGAAAFEGEGARKRIIGLIGTVEDITARKLAETQLRESEERLRSVTDNASVGLVTLDPRRRYTFVNPAYVRILAIDKSPAELIGSGPAEILPSSYAEQIAPRLDRAFAGERVSYELTRPADDEGASRQFTVIYDPMRDKDRNVVGVIVVIFDITERKQAEEVLARSAGLRAIGQLVGGVAHDVGNLLTVISGNLQLAELELRGGKALACVQNALDAAERGASFNRRLMSLTDHRRTRARAIDVNAQVEQTASLLRRTLGEAVKINLGLAAQACQAIIDPAELESALLNLSLNARDAMPEGGELTISTHVVASHPGLSAAMAAADSAFVRVDVTDTGFGMSAELLRRVKDPFFTTKGPGKGAGLGLNSVLKSIEAVGGYFGLESAPGKGTTASLYLPRVSGSEPAAPDASHSPTRRHGKGELILVVEDDPEVCSVVEKRLKALGYAVRSANTAREALAILELGNEVRLVFSDIMLPEGMSGIDLVRRIEANKLQIPTVLTSAYHTNNEMMNGIEVLEKPYSLAQLAEAIYTALHVPPSR